MLRIKEEFEDLRLISYKTDGTWYLDIDLNYTIKKNDLLVFMGESKHIKDFYINNRSKSFY